MGKNKKLKNKTIKVIQTEEEIRLKELIGFNCFLSTKNKSHVDTDVSGVFLGKKVKTKCSQYMNRRFGFNRPLDKIN